MFLTDAFCQMNLITVPDKNIILDKVLFHHLVENDIYRLSFFSVIESIHTV